MSDIYTWSHAAGEYIVDSFEMEEGFSIPVSVSAGTEGELATPSSLTVTFHDLPLNLITFVEDGTTVTVEADTRLGFFEIEIDYLETRLEASQTTITNWGDLPPSSKEIVRYRAPDVAMKEYTMTFEADGTGGIESRTLYIRIWFDYDTGRDTLKSEVDLRRFTPLVPTE